MGSAWSAVKTVSSASQGRWTLMHANGSAAGSFMRGSRTAPDPMGCLAASSHGPFASIRIIFRDLRETFPCTAACRTGPGRVV